MTKAPLYFDYLIIGAGLIGSSTAMHLSTFLSKKGKSIAVLDADLSGRFSSSELNAGGARSTWKQDINIMISMDSISYLEKEKESTGFRPCAYLWLQKKKEEKESQMLMKKWNSYGLAVEWLTVQKLSKKLPFIDKTDDLSGAIFSPKDGLFNPNRLKESFRKKAIENSVEFIDKHRILGIQKLKGDSIEIECSVMEPEEVSIKNFLSTDLGKQKRQNITHIRGKVLVNCTGAWSQDISKLYQHASYAKPIRRQISVFHNKELSIENHGLIVDTSKVYFHSESDNILAGYAEPGEPISKNLSYGGNSFFEEKIWTPLYKRSSKFSQLKHITGWAGLYSVSPDSTAILGKLGAEKNIYESYGYSGRGAMQSYAAGRGLAELIAFGSFESLDLQCLSGERFQKNELLLEDLLI